MAKEFMPELNRLLKDPDPELVNAVNAFLDIYVCELITLEFTAEAEAKDEEQDVKVDDLNKAVDKIAESFVGLLLALEKRHKDYKAKEATVAV